MFKNVLMRIQHTESGCAIWTGVPSRTLIARYYKHVMKRPLPPNVVVHGRTCENKKCVAPDHLKFALARMVNENIRWTF